MPEAMIIYFQQPAKVRCDGKCEKAWGRGDRPQIQLSDDPDDYAYLADDEVGIAPVDPGTEEGPDRKPLSVLEFPNKWCVRACERCSMSRLHEWKQPLELIDLSKRFYNMKWRDEVK